MADAALLPACHIHTLSQVDQIAKDYYQRLEPRDAAVLVKQLNVGTGGEA